MKDLIEKYLNYLRYTKKSSENTIISYGRDLNKACLYLKDLGLEKLEDINGTSLNSYVLYLEREGKSSATVSRTIASLKGLYLYGIKQGVVREDPTEYLKPPKVVKTTPEIISMDKIKMLLNYHGDDTNKNLRDKAILELLYATGIKASELICIEVSDVNLEMEFIRVNQGSKERVVPIDTTTKTALSEYILKARDNMCKEGNLLFTNIRGERLTRQGLWKIVKQRALMAGITDNITPNVIRNSFAYYMALNGADIRSISKMLGYTDLAPTEVYMRFKTDNRIKEVYNNTHHRN